MALIRKKKAIHPARSQDWRNRDSARRMRIVRNRPHDMRPPWTNNGTAEYAYDVRVRVTSTGHEYDHGRGAGLAKPAEAANGIHRAKAGLRPDVVLEFQLNGSGPIARFNSLMNRLSFTRYLKHSIPIFPFPICSCRSFRVPKSFIVSFR